MQGQRKKKNTPGFGFGLEERGATQSILYAGNATGRLGEINRQTVRDQAHFKVEERIGNEKEIEKQQLYLED